MQIKANPGTLNSATDGDMDIAFALLLASRVCVNASFAVQIVSQC